MYNYLYAFKCSDITKRHNKETLDEIFKTRNIYLYFSNGVKKNSCPWLIQCPINEINKYVYYTHIYKET